MSVLIGVGFEIVVFNQRPPAGEIDAHGLALASIIYATGLAAFVGVLMAMAASNLTIAILRRSVED